MPPQVQEQTRGTAYCVAIGLFAAIIGGMLLAAASSSPENRDLLSGLGYILVLVGSPMFFIAVLVELFSIGSSVRRLESALSLLLESRAPAPDTKLPPTTGAA